MTRKKTDDTARGVAEIEGVLLGNWRGMVQYRCRLCPFDTLDRERFIEHFAAVHPPLEVIEGGYVPADPPVGEQFEGAE